MKKLYLLSLAILSIGSMHAKVVGDTIMYNGKLYYVGQNKIANGSFDKGFTGWYDGTSTTIPGTSITEANWSVNKNGGVDGNWLISNANTGKTGAGSLCTAWPISKDTIYYFSYYISNRGKSTDANVGSFQVVSATNTIATETLPLLGLGNNNSNKAIFGQTKVASGDTTWVQNAFTFDNTLSDRQYQYMQVCFRWENKAFGFDNFYLAPLLDASKITQAELVQIRFLAKINELQKLSGSLVDRSGLCILCDETASEMYDIDRDNADAMAAGITKMDSVIAVTNQANTDIATLKSLIASCQTIYETTFYAGYDTYGSALEAIKAVYDNDAESTADDYAKAITDLKAALNKYRLSQVATKDSPANYTFMISYPNFSTAASVAGQDAKGTTAISTGWIKGSTYTGNDQKASYRQGRDCWNAWWSVNIATAGTGNMDVHQNLSKLPNGYYAISCAAITQSGCLTNQHAYVSSTAGTTVSPILSETNWNGDDATGTGKWDTLTTAKIIVSDGNLTIGFTSDKTNAVDGASGTGDNREGWWCATDFQLFYYGAADDDELTVAYNAKITAANAFADTMHFASDKKAFADIIAANTGATDKDAIATAMTNIANAMTTATKSESKYTEIFTKGKTIPTVTDSLAKSGTAYGAANSIVKYALGKMTDFINAETTTYTLVDNMITKMKKYTSDYTTAYNAVNDSVNKFISASAKEVLVNLMATQKTYLVSSDTLYATALIDTCIAKINKTMRTCAAQNIYEKDKNATDYTFMIQNPHAGGTVNTTTGWVINRGKGNTDTAAGQHYSGNTSLRYFDSWNATTGVLNYYGYQEITGIPNGTYIVKAAGRNGKDMSTVVTDGAFIFASNGSSLKSDTVWQEIKSASYTFINDATGKDTTVCQGDVYGKIWEVATVASQAGTATALESAESAANNGIGRGWNWYSISYEVTNHKIVIGMCTDSLRTGKPFTGQWFSVVDFTLTKTANGDNTDWNGPITGVSNITTTEKNAIDGIYNLAGVKMNSNLNLPKGVYIVKEGNVTKKILVK